MKESKNNEGAHVEQQVTFGEGTSPDRGRWPFAGLTRKGTFFEVADLTKHVALRTAASRAHKKLKRKFSVRKETFQRNGADVTVIRVYRV